MLPPPRSEYNLESAPFVVDGLDAHFALLVAQAQLERLVVEHRPASIPAVLRGALVKIVRARDEPATGWLGD